MLLHGLITPSLILCLLSSFWKVRVVVVVFSVLVGGCFCLLDGWLAEPENPDVLVLSTIRCTSLTLVIIQIVLCVNLYKSLCCIADRKNFWLFHTFRYLIASLSQKVLSSTHSKHLSRIPHSSVRDYKNSNYPKFRRFTTNFSP